MVSSSVVRFSPPPTEPSDIPLCNTGICNSGGSDIYFYPYPPLAEINPTAPKVRVGTAIGSIQHYLASSKLGPPQLSEEIQTGHVIPTFKHMLIGIFKLCDAHRKVTFTKDNVTVYKKWDNPILNGWRGRSGAKLWRFAMRQNDQINDTEAKEMNFQAFSAYDLPSV